MKNFKKISAILFFSVYLILGLGCISPALAADEIFFKPQIGVGTEFPKGGEVSIGKVSGSVVTSDLLAKYIKAFYNWGLSIVGVLAVLMLMAGGLIWLTSAGDSGKIENAKKMISGSLFGALLLVGAYFFLNTINPDLTRLPVISLDVIDKKDMGYGCCTDGVLDRMTTENNCNGTFSKTKLFNFKNGKCEERACCTNTITIDNKAVTYCFESVPSNCSQKKIAGYCSKVNDCQGATVSCTGISNGGKAKSILGNSGFYCYNESVYSSLGKESEPCGSYSRYPGYGICQKNSLDCYYENNIGGRDCETGLTCCLKQSKTSGATGGWK